MTTESVRPLGPAESPLLVVCIGASTGGLEAPAQPAASRAAPPQRRRVVIVDDNADAAEALALLLELGGYESHTAHDGPSGISLITQVKPDIVLLDIGLPRIDGYQVARTLRSTPGLEHLALIAVSGYSHDEARQHSLDAGFDHHLVKPVGSDELLSLLAQLLPKPS